MNFDEHKRKLAIKKSYFIQEVGSKQYFNIK